MVRVGVDWMSIEMGECENSSYLEAPRVASGSYCGRGAVGCVLCLGEHGLVTVGFCRNKDGGVEEGYFGKQLEAGLRGMDRDCSLSKATV